MLSSRSLRVSSRQEGFQIVRHSPRVGAANKYGMGMDKEKFAAGMSFSNELVCCWGILDAGVER